MSKLIKFAKEFALKHHGKQEHGCLFIEEHLADVAKNVSLHTKNSRDWKYYHDEAVAGAWLHDLIEDTNVTLDQLRDEMTKQGFSDRSIAMVCHIVGCVTDGPGKSRKERHLNTYHKIRNNSLALLVKLCDRRHNHERSIKHGEIYAAMYAKEWDYFRFALWSPRQFTKLWAALSKQNKRLQEIVGW